MSEMIRTQIYLSPEQHEQLKERGARDKKTMAYVVREAVDQYLLQGQNPPVFPADDPLYDLIGLFRSGLKDVSANHDKYLYDDPHK